MGSFAAGVSGLQAAQASLNLTAHNISNATTVGYSRQQTLNTDHTYETVTGPNNKVVQVGMGTEIAMIRQIRNKFLDSQYRLQIGRQSFYEAQADTMSEIEDLFGELNGEEFSTSMSDLKDKFQQLATSPDDIVRREQVVSTGVAFVQKAQVLQDQLKKYQVNLNDEIVKKVDRINTIAKDIHTLNEKIKRYEVNGEEANDYRDARNSLLDELSGLVKYESNEEMDGVVTVYVQGCYLVSQDRASTLGTEKVDETTQMLKPVWLDNGGGDLFTEDSLKSSMEQDTDVGSLKGLLVSRGSKVANFTDIPVKPDVADYTDAAGNVDQVAYQQAMTNYKVDSDQYVEYLSPSVIIQVQAQLDQLVHGMVTMINDTLCPNKELTLADGSKITVLDTDKAPIGDDADKTIGTELFSRKSTDRYTKVTVETADGPQEVYKYNEEDPSDPYTLYTISELRVNPTLLQNSSLLPLTSNNNGGYVDGYTMETTQAIVDNWNKEFASLSPDKLTKYSYNDYYRAMIGDLATQGQVWNSIVENQTSLTQNVDNKRQDEMGVSTDEELASLIKFQHSYNASSRYITVIDEMLEHLINKLGG